MPPTSGPPKGTKQLGQTFLATRIPLITAETVWETELTSERLDALLDGAHTKPRAVGLAPGYTPAGRLAVLAVAVGQNVLLIRFKSQSKVSAAVVDARKLLKEALLCNDANRLHAFDGAPLALSLYADRDLRIAGLVDIQSGCTCKDNRVVANAVEFAMSSTEKPGIARGNIETAFANQVYDEAKPAPVALKAWLAGYLPTVSDMEQRFGDVAKINTDQMEENKLLVLAQFSRSDQRLESAKPGATNHEFAAVGSTDNKFKLNSARFQTRVHGRNGRVEMSVTDRFGAQYTITGSVSDVQGQGAVLKAAKDTIIEGKVVNSVRSIGPSGPTLADQQKMEAILAILQNTSSLFESPFLQTIFNDGKTVEWPDTLPTLDDTPPITFDQRPLNASQQQAVEAMLTVTNTSRITVIHGPPGTGKTTVITAYVHSAEAAGLSGIWLVAQSNVAVKNIAEKLADTGFEPWRLLVSKDFHMGWHEHLYHTISKHIIRSDDFKNAPRELQGCKVILCTLSMLSNTRIGLFTARVPVRTVVVDEASQIALSDYIGPLKAFPKVEKLCFIGDDKQLPPYGQEEIKEIKSIFEVPHLRTEAIFLDTQYRMPITIGEFISDAVYNGQLLSSHKISDPACFFVDVPTSTEKRFQTSWENLAERQAVCKIAARLQEEDASFRIITPYDAQRSALESDLKAAGLSWQNKCFNVDSFQGNEDDNIIISLVRSKDLGFLKDERRTNVMLSRCKQAMFICTSWDFLVAGKGAQSLVGRMAAACGDDAWLSMQDIEEGNF